MTRPVRLAMALSDLDDIPVVTQRQIPMVHTVQKTKEIPQLQTVEKTAETPQAQTIQRAQAPESLGTTLVCQVAQGGTSRGGRDGNASTYRIRTTHVRLDTVPQFVEELAETSMVFSQDKVQQRFGEQTTETPAISLGEKIVEMTVTRTQEKTQQVVNTHVFSTLSTQSKVEKAEVIKQKTAET